MKTILEVIQLSTDFLHKKGVANARRQAEEIMSDALGLQRLDLYLQFDRPLLDTELETCRTRLSRRSKGEPVQYIKGEVDFLECKIKVSPDTLIPRQETEILTDKISKQLSETELENKILWDVCCGSGCIGIALKKRHPALKVILSDLSSEALAMARENARLNQVDVNFLEGDLLMPFKGQKSHFIVCNPPYVTETEFPHLDTEVREHEPRQALVSGPTGLEFYQRLAHDLPPFLESGCRIWLEIGKGQGPAIKKLFSDPRWITCNFEQDWGGNDRFFFLEVE